MDLETENRIAAILLREAAELRRQAEKDGVRAYLEKPNVRHRPNSRFLTATVLGVQQANKAVEVNEMWKLRSQEVELDERLKRKSREEESSHACERGSSSSRRSFVKNYSPVDESGSTATLLSRRTSKSCDSEKEEEYEEGLRDEEIETFLLSRVKRGRGSIGSRMDETGPYLPKSAGAPAEPSRTSDAGDRLVFPQSKRLNLPRQDSEPLRTSDVGDSLVFSQPKRQRRHSRQDSDFSSEEEKEVHLERSRKKARDHDDKKRSKKHKTKEKKRDSKKKTEEKKKKRHRG